MKGKLKMKKQKKTFKVILLGLGCLAFLPQMQGVSPPPDGCYPNSTTAEGCKALQSLTTGVANTAIGWYSLFGTSSGSNNTAVGAGALDLNTADNNTAVGVAALLLNTTGINNTANGVGALVFNNTAEENTATGAFAMYSNTEGEFNTANGAFALYFNTTGERNTAIGDSALYQNIGGSRNTAVGNPALLSNTTGNDNTAVGAGALILNHVSENTAIGADALSADHDGAGNTATGVLALRDNIIGNDNTASGNRALLISNANDNSAVGAFSLSANTTGFFNTALGFGAGTSVVTANNVICIGANIAGADVDNSCYIGSIWQQAGGSQAVYVNASGKLGAQVSSRRFKDEIKPMEEASEVIYLLKPVSFRYKQEIEPARPVAFGLIAEEVEEVNPDLVARDKEGKPYSVRYDQVNAMLLNEFLKEHQTVQAQQKEIDALKQELKEQRALIETVTARIGSDKAEPQLVVDKL